MTTQQPWRQPYIGGLADREQRPHTPVSQVSAQWQQHHVDQSAGQQVMPATHQPTYRGPARTAHGLTYWLLVGWWWETTKFASRVGLWFFFWPLGLWRSWRHHKKNQERRVRRGYR